MWQPCMWAKGSPESEAFWGICPHSSCLPPLTAKMVVNPKPKSNINNLLLEIYGWLSIEKSKNVHKAEYIFETTSCLQPTLPKSLIVAAKGRVITWKFSRMPWLSSGIRLSSSRKQYSRHCIYSGHILTHSDLDILWLKDQNGGGIARRTVHKQSGQTITDPCIHLQKQDNSYSKSKSAKRLQETGTPPCSIRRNLFNEALTDGLWLESHPRAHPDTDRAHSDDLFHCDNPYREEVEIGRGKQCLNNDTLVQLDASCFSGFNMLSVNLLLLWH